MNLADKREVQRQLSVISNQPVAQRKVGRFTEQEYQNIAANLFGGTARQVQGGGIPMSAKLRLQQQLMGIRTEGDLERFKQIVNQRYKLTGDDVIKSAFSGIGRKLAANQYARAGAAGLGTAALESAAFYVAGEHPIASALLHAGVAPLSRMGKKTIMNNMQPVTLSARDAAITAGLGAVRSGILTGIYHAIPGALPAITALAFARGALSQLPAAQQAILRRAAGSRRVLDGWVRAARHGTLKPREMAARGVNRAQHRMTGSVPAPTHGQRPSKTRRILRGTYIPKDGGVEKSASNVIPFRRVVDGAGKCAIIPRRFTQQRALTC